MGFSDHKWELEVVNGDRCQVTTIGKRKVTLLCKSRGSPGVNPKGMGVDRDLKFFRIDSEPWRISHLRTQMDIVRKLEEFILEAGTLWPWSSYIHLGAGSAEKRTSCGI